MQSISLCISNQEFCFSFHLMPFYEDLAHNVFSFVCLKTISGFVKCTIKFSSSSIISVENSKSGIYTVNKKYNLSLHIYELMIFNTFCVDIYSYF